MRRFLPRVAEKLKYYAYLYVDPRTEQPFYIGKGKGNRAFSHLKATGEGVKDRTIAELRKLGMEPRIELLGEKRDSHRFPGDDASLELRFFVR